MSSSMGPATIVEEMKYMRQTSGENMKASREDDEPIPMFESFKVCKGCFLFVNILKPYFNLNENAVTAL